MYRTRQRPTRCSRRPLSSIWRCGAEPCRPEAAAGPGPLKDAAPAFAAAMKDEFKKAKALSERYKVAGANHDLGMAMW